MLSRRIMCCFLFGAYYICPHAYHILRHLIDLCIIELKGIGESVEIDLDRFRRQSDEVVVAGESGLADRHIQAEFIPEPVEILTEPGGVSAVEFDLAGRAFAMNELDDRDRRQKVESLQGAGTRLVVDQHHEPSVRAR